MDEKKIITAAYVPFKTFESTLDHLKAHSIPNIIDRSFFPSKSGAIQGQIIGTYRFLNLIDDEGKPTENLEKLVNDEENRKGFFKEILQKSYLNLFEADLERVTPAQFENLFSPEIYGVSGDTKNKAKSFLFFALKYANVPFSKLLVQRTRSPRKKKTAMTNNNEHASKENSDTTPPPQKKDNHSTIHGQALKSVELVDSKKTVWLGSDANIVEVEFGRDMEFILGLIQLFKLYENNKRFEIREVES